MQEPAGQAEADKAAKLAGANDDVLPDADTVSDTPGQLAPEMVEGAATVAPLDLATVEQAIQNFFNQLTDLDAQLVGGSTAKTLVPWLLALTAAGVACELARRHVKQYLTAAGGEAGVTLAWWSSLAGALPLEPS